MRKCLIVVCTVVLLFNVNSFIQAQDMLPFAVIVDGQEALPGENASKFGKISDPVSNNAEIDIDDNSGMVIINVFPSDSNGNATAGTTPSVIIIQGDNKSTLDKTMDQKKLKPGAYVMNIIASGKTARVFFHVK